MPRSADGAFTAVESHWRAEIPREIVFSPATRRELSRKRGLLSSFGSWQLHIVPKSVERTSPATAAHTYM